VLTLSSVLILSGLFSLFFHQTFVSREIASVNDSTNMIADFMNRGMTGDALDYIGQNRGPLRMTVITPDGTVLLDNTANAEIMENHSDRAEIIEAFLTGSGQATRYSDTLRAETYYYAVLLENGNVLRLSKTMENINRIFMGMLPIVVVVTIFVLLLANFLARRLTNHIVRPFENIVEDGDMTPVYDEILPYIKKINKQKREISGHVAVLKNRYNTIAAIAGSIKEGLIIIDRTGQILIASRSASDIFHEDDMDKKNILHICRDVAFNEGVKKCLSGMSAEITFERAGRVYDVFFSPLHDGGKINGGVILMLDISEKYAAEKQRREFSANVSHELKTPLTTVSMLAEMIENGMAQEGDIKGFAGKISAQTSRTINLIDNIIRLSEFDENKVAAAHCDFDLYELTVAVVEALQERADEKRVSVDITGERFHVTANRQMIDELLYNLIDNAIKYNKEGGEVTVTLSRENGLCKITVADTGIGIPEEHQTRVFERFYRVDRSRSKKTGGTGLGLSIVKHIAEHHGGGAALTSVGGTGTTVECWFAVNFE